MAAPIRIVLADDHELFRQGLTSLLKHQPDLTIVAETDRVDTLRSLLDETPCDLLLLDLQMERSALAEIVSISSASSRWIRSATFCGRPRVTK